MRLSYIALVLLPLSLAACQTHDIQNVRDQAVQLLQQKNPTKTLAAYTWQTDTGAPKPLILNFAQDGRLAISTSCNSITTSWQVDGQDLVTGNSMMTQMACPTAAMRQEAFAAQLFDQAKIPFVIDASDSQKPTLTLMDNTGKRYVFTGSMTAETQYQGEGQVMFYEIHPQTKTCTGMMRQQCLQVKEIRYNQQGLKIHQDANWSLFYGQIQGFEHNPKERQVIRVKRYDIKNPAADQSKYAYVYDMTIERGMLK